MKLDESKVVVVGGSSGIGLGVAAVALERGAQVVLVGRSQSKLLEASKALGSPTRVQTIAADVTQEQQVAGLFAQVGAFDHLVITRGVVPVDAPIATFDLDVARRFIDVMLVSAISLVKHAQGKLSSTGSITLTSGISKDRPSVPGGSVVAAVAGSFGYLARQLAMEIAPARVNVVSPGWVDTPMWDDIVGPAKTGLWQEMASRLPAGRIASVSDIALAYVYLMESEFTTGTVLDIDGGHALV
jgi:NAD(P)-dependent dehydrogenase (short-subunit alcohol dehydrogenase family)